MENLPQDSHATPLPEHLNPQVIRYWKAPLRPYKKRGKHVLRFYLALAFLLSAIVFFFGDRILLIPIWSLVFLFYTLTITPPPIVENRITKFGIETAGITLRWEILSHFFFTNRFNYDVLTLVTQPPYSLRAYLVVPDAETKEKVMRVLAEHIMYQDQPLRTFSDRMIDWLSHLIPDDEDEKEEKSTKTKTTGNDSNSGANDKKEAKASDTYVEKDTQEIKTEGNMESSQKEDSSQKPEIDSTSQPSSASFPPTPMPESLLRHISEPSVEAPRQL